MTKTETLLRRCREDSEDDIGAEGLRDLLEIDVDASMGPEQRVRSLIEQLGNPYRFRVGGVAVRLEFEGNSTLEECLSHFLDNFDASRDDREYDEIVGNAGPKRLTKAKRTA